MPMRRWLAFLATRRDTFIVPTTNCLGYIQRVRSDAGVDPNRDFPYRRGDRKCMLSSTARVVQALMRENIIQLVVTFHGGMVAIGYEWGSLNHLKPRDACPDDVAHRDIADKLAGIAGTFADSDSEKKKKKKKKLYPSKLSPRTSCS